MVAADIEILHSLRISLCHTMKEGGSEDKIFESPLLEELNCPNRVLTIDAKEMCSILCYRAERDRYISNQYQNSNDQRSKPLSSGTELQSLQSSSSAKEKCKMLRSFSSVRRMETECHLPSAVYANPKRME